jgi:hypothetical protein
MLLSIDDDRLFTRNHDKRHNRFFHMVNGPVLDINIPAGPAYGMYVSQLVWYAQYKHSAISTVPAIYYWIHDASAWVIYLCGELRRTNTSFWKGLILRWVVLFCWLSDSTTQWIVLEYICLYLHRGKLRLSYLWFLFHTNACPVGVHICSICCGLVFLLFYSISLISIQIQACKVISQEFAISFCFFEIAIIMVD